jgi:hypothetical protein
MRFQVSRWLGTPIFTAIQGSINRKVVVQASSGIKQDPVSKIPNTKRPGGVTQAVQCLSSKCKSLSSALSIDKNIKA